MSYVLMLYQNAWMSGMMKMNRKNPSSTATTTSARPDGRGRRGLVRRVRASATSASATPSPMGAPPMLTGVPPDQLASDRSSSTDVATNRSPASALKALMSTS